MALYNLFSAWGLSVKCYQNNPNWEFQSKLWQWDPGCKRSKLFLYHKEECTTPVFMWWALNRDTISWQCCVVATLTLLSPLCFIVQTSTDGVCVHRAAGQGAAVLQRESTADPALLRPGQTVHDLCPAGQEGKPWLHAAPRAWERSRLLCIRMNVSVWMWLVTPGFSTFHQFHTPIVFLLTISTPRLFPLNDTLGRSTWNSLFFLWDLLLWGN